LIKINVDQYYQVLVLEKFVILTLPSKYTNLLPSG